MRSSISRKRTYNKRLGERREDVNVSYEFFDDYKELIVSKKVEQIISKYVTYAEFLPVFER